MIKRTVPFTTGDPLIMGNRTAAFSAALFLEKLLELNLLSVNGTRAISGNAVFELSGLN